MKEYLKALEHCYKNGTDVISRAGKVRKAFGYQMRFDLSIGFPALTTKKLAWKAVTSELIWFLEGSNDERRLAEILYQDDRKNLKDKKTIWTENAHSEYWKDRAKFEGDVGRIYGVQWRDFNGTDQIKNLIKSIKDSPDSRRHILSAWNPSELDLMSLPPCHAFSQFFVSRGKLSCQLYQRSCDMFLGVPFNIASYSFLLCILCHLTKYKPGRLIHILGDSHIYEDHINAVKQQIIRVPVQYPTLDISYQLESIDDIQEKYFTLENYKSYPKLLAPMIA